MKFITTSSDDSVFVPRKRGYNRYLEPQIPKIGFSQPESKNIKISGLMLQSEGRKVCKHMEKQNVCRKRDTSTSKPIHQLVKI